MIVAVDTNIVFSGVLSPGGTIGDLLLNSSDVFDWFAPAVIVDEIDRHYHKLLTLSGLSRGEIDFLIRTILKKVDLISLEQIREETWMKAIDLTKSIDEFDAPFIALSIELQCPLWTGDKKLTKELNKKGIDWILDTKTIKEIRDR